MTVEVQLKSPYP